MDDGYDSTLLRAVFRRQAAATTPDIPTRPPWTQATSIVYAVLVACALVLRLFSRVRFTKRFGADDLFASLGTIIAIAAYTLATIAAQDYGMNRHTHDIPPTMLYTTTKLDYIYNILFSQAACQSKLSILWFTRRLVGNAFSSIFNFYYLAMIFLTVFVFLDDVVYLIVSLAECRPLEAAWDPNPAYAYHCINSNYFMMVAGLINTATDFCCTMLPALIVLRLHMSLRRRLGVALIFLVGISVNVASALRIYYAFHQYATGDMWDSMQSYITSNSELGLGLLCVNSAPIRPLFNYYFTNFVTDRSGPYNSALSSRHNHLSSGIKRRRAFDTFGESLTAISDSKALTVAEQETEGDAPDGAGEDGRDKPSYALDASEEGGVRRTFGVNDGVGEIMGSAAEGFGRRRGEVTCLSHTV